MNDTDLDPKIDDVRPNVISLDGDDIDTFETALNHNKETLGKKIEQDMQTLESTMAELAKNEPDIMADIEKIAEDNLSGIEKTLDEGENA